MNNQTKNTVPKTKKIRKLPEIKQTKTSLLRLLKTNPLLETDPKFTTANNTLSSTLFSTANNETNHTSCYGNGSKNPTEKIVKKTVQNTAKPAEKVLKSKVRNEIAKIPKPAQDKEQKVNSKLCQRKELKPIIKVSEEKKPQPRRRSLSAQHFDRKKGISFNKNIPKLTRGQSIEDITISPVPEERSSPRKSLYHYNCAPDVNNLKQGLNNWLKKRGKSLVSYPHLKCFNIQCDNDIIDEENKENIEVLSEKSDSYESLMIKTTKEPTIHDNLQNIASSALEDLNKLVHEGYASDQCENWLKLIQNKFENVVNQANYWECRASIEQARGNFAQAVDCYQNAIIQGAKIENVAESLDDLLKKFSLLNLSPKPEIDNKDRTRTVQEARNIFKSSIIQFAIQKKKSIKSDSTNLNIDAKFIATPIRRSTRLSRTAYTSTPGLLVCSSLRDLSPNLQKNLDFQKNKALL